jgi:hypothetical protein
VVRGPLAEPAALEEPDGVAGARRAVGDRQADDPAADDGEIWCRGGGTQVAAPFARMTGIRS